MQRLSATFATVVLCLNLHGGEAAPAADVPDSSDANMFDLLGGATWQQRRIDLTLGLVDLSVDGMHGNDQRALFISGSGQAVSGYQFNAKSPAGGILGLGATAKGWWGHDDIDLWAAGPFATAIAGVYADLNDRLRLELTADAGPGLAIVSIQGQGDSLQFAWTWGIESAVSITRGENVGLGVAIGYAETHVTDFDQQGLYLALRIGF
jgi:hypothetical protein